MLAVEFHITAGTFLCAAAVSCPHFVGLYLFRAGCNDFHKGCAEMWDMANPVDKQLQFLKLISPVCCLVRMFCAPALWYYMAEQNDLYGGLHSLPVLLWILLWATPFVLFNMVLLKPGIRSVLSSDQTIAEWPSDCAVQRPYHGLLSTRCHALNGAFYIELLWNMWIIYQDNNVALRVGGISIAMFIFNAGMLAGGPMNFLSRGPKVDGWVAETYLVVSLCAVNVYLLLDHAWFGLKVAVDHTTNMSRFGPYGHWSVLAWNCALLVQVGVCRFAVTNALELKKGAPWSCGGCDHKEFYFPRFWGLIYVCYGMFFSFNLWIVGIWLWVPPQPTPFTPVLI